MEQGCQKVNVGILARGTRGPGRAKARMLPRNELPQFGGGHAALGQRLTKIELA